MSACSCCQVSCWCDGSPISSERHRRDQPSWLVNDGVGFNLRGVCPTTKPSRRRVRDPAPKSGGRVGRRRLRVSIHLRWTKDGARRYDLRLRDPSGRVYTRTFRTRREAEAFEADERASRRRGSWLDPRRAEEPLRAAAAQWLDSNPAKRPSSRARDESALRTHILSALGDRPIGSLTPSDIQQCVNGWSRRLAPRSVRRVYQTLAAVLNAAYSKASTSIPPRPDSVTPTRGSHSVSTPKPAPKPTATPRTASATDSSRKGPRQRKRPHLTRDGRAMETGTKPAGRPEGRP